MVDTRCLRGCALLFAATMLGGCGRTVEGSPRLAGSEMAAQPVPIADLLLEPDRFPPQYPAVVLDDAVVDRAQQDIDGVPVGSIVTPAVCTPPVLWHSELVGVEGVDNASASRLIVLVTRPAPPLSDRLGQLRACPSFDVGHGADVSTVEVTVLPAPPVDAEATYAVRQTVTTSDSERALLTFAAQIGDARVSATWLQDPAVDHADTSALDTLFRDAVVKLRRDG